MFLSSQADGQIHTQCEGISTALRFLSTETPLEGRHVLDASTNDPSNDFNDSRCMAFDSFPSEIDIYYVATHNEASALIKLKGKSLVL